jgi:hypothetical protein
MLGSETVMALREQELPGDMIPGWHLNVKHYNKIDVDGQLPCLILNWRDLFSLLII